MMPVPKMQMQKVFKIKTSLIRYNIIFTKEGKRTAFNNNELVV